MTPGPDPSAKEAKASMRRAVDARLRAMSPAARSTGSVAIAGKVRKLDPFRHARTVMLYTPFGVEVDVGPLAVGVLGAGGRVCLPAFDVPTGRMWAVRLEGDWTPEQWPRGRFGVPTSPGAERVEPASIDAVIVPGVAFDAARNRLGRGMGFYDRFLRDTGLEAVSIGVAFEEQMVERVPCEAGDVALHMVITNERCIPSASC